MRAKTKPAPVPPEENQTATTAPVLTIGDLMGHLFAAGIDFKFGLQPEHVPDRRFGACVFGEICEGPDAVETLLQAMALGVRSEQAKIDKYEALSTARKAILAKINELVPGLTAHTPATDGNKCACGQDHASPEALIDAVMADLGERFGVKVTKIERALTPAKKERPKKPTN